MRLPDCFHKWYARGRTVLTIPRAQRWRDVFEWDAAPILIGPPSMLALCISMIVHGRYELLPCSVLLLAGDVLYLYEMLAPAVKADTVPYKAIQTLDNMGWQAILTDELRYVFYKKFSDKAECIVFMAKQGFWACAAAHHGSLYDSLAVHNCPALMPLCSARTPQEMARRVELRHRLNPDKW